MVKGLAVNAAHATSARRATCFLLLTPPLLVVAGALDSGRAAAQSAPPTVRLPPASAVATEQFTDVVGIRELEDGRVLIGDRVEKRLAVADADLRAIVTIGREGSGPGEYLAPVGLVALPGDSTLFTDAGRRWLLLDGPRIVHTLSAEHPVGEVIGPRLNGADVDGHLLGVTGYVFSMQLPGSPGMADSLIIMRADRASARMDTIARVGGRGRYGVRVVRGGRGGSVSLHPMSTEDQALLFPDGWIAVAYAEPYRVEWRRPDGEWQRGRPLPFTATRVDEREKCHALQRNARQRRAECNAAAVPAWPGVLPAFMPNALFGTPDGLLLIRRTDGARSTENRYDIVDRRGALVSVLMIPLDHEIVGFGKTSVYVVSDAGLGLKRLQRHPW